MSVVNSPAFLFICRHSAWSSQAAACLETVLTAGVFEQDAALVLDGDGVLQLLPGQDGSGLRQKTLANQLPALELYGITQIYVEYSAVHERGLSLDDFVLPAVPLQQGQLRDMIAASQHVLVF
jgi:tRNA 2-thiouridine synthesizing protein C